MSLGEMLVESALRAALAHLSKDPENPPEEYLRLREMLVNYADQRDEITFWLLLAEAEPDRRILLVELMGAVVASGADRDDQIVQQSIKILHRSQGNPAVDADYHVENRRDSISGGIVRGQIDTHAVFIEGPSDASLSGRLNLKPPVPPKPPEPDKEKDGEA